MQSNIEIFVSTKPEYWDRVDIFILQKNGSEVKIGSFDKSGYLEFKNKIIEGEMNSNPTFSIPKSYLQIIIDKFTGEVPSTKEAQNEAELKATKYHLEDMRKLLKIK